MKNNNNYGYSKTQANKIIHRLNSEMNNIKHRFKHGGNIDKEEFKL